MTMNRVEGDIKPFLNDSDEAKSRLAKRITSNLQSWQKTYGDFSLDKRAQSGASASRFEAIATPLSPETQKLVEHMRGDGYAVYETFGKTPAGVKGEGMKFWFLNSKLADLTAAPALLAFKKKPSEFFLAESHDILHYEQVKLIPEEQAKVNKKYPGAGLIVDEGELPEWTELAWTHFQATDRKVRLLGKDFGYNYTSTKTYESDERGARRAFFGFWHEAGGARVGLWDPDGVDPGVGLAPLVRIPRK